MRRVRNLFTFCHPTQASLRFVWPHPFSLRWPCQLKCRSQRSSDVNITAGRPLSPQPRAPGLGPGGRDQSLPLDYSQSKRRRRCYMWRSGGGGRGVKGLRNAPNYVPSTPFLFLFFLWRLSRLPERLACTSGYGEPMRRHRSVTEWHQERAAPPTLPLAGDLPGGRRSWWRSRSV